MGVTLERILLTYYYNFSLSLLVVRKFLKEEFSISHGYFVDYCLADTEHYGLV
jgi:hypothetical protein